MALVDGSGATPEPTLAMSRAFVPGDVMRAQPPNTGGVPHARPACDACGGRGVELVLCTFSLGTTAGTVKDEAIWPRTPSVPPRSFNIDGLLLPVTLILEEFGEDRGGLSEGTAPGFHPREGEGAGFDGALVRASLY